MVTCDKYRVTLILTSCLGLCLLDSLPPTGFLTKNFACMSLLFHTSCMICACPPSIHYPNNSLCSSLSYNFSKLHHFLPLRSKHPPQHYILIHSEPIFFPYLVKVSHSYRLQQAKLMLYFIISMYFNNRLEEKRFLTKW